MSKAKTDSAIDYMLDSIEQSIDIMLPDAIGLLSCRMFLKAATITASETKHFSKLTLQQREILRQLSEQLDEAAERLM